MANQPKALDNHKLEDTQIEISWNDSKFSENESSDGFHNHPKRKISCIDGN